MSQFKFIDSSIENLRKYWDGPSNRFSRYFTYWQRGMGWLNEARLYLYLLGGGIFASEFIEVFGYKIPVELIMIGAALGIPIIVLIGRWDLFKLNKAREFINSQYGSVIGYNNYNMQVLQVHLLEKIAEKLGVDTEKLKEELNK